MEYILAPSILSADLCRLGDEIKALENAGIKYLHFDVMDGMFVPSISFGMPLLRAVRKKTNMILDVHLMIQDPDRYLEEFAKCGADIITVHAEACTHLHRTISKIHELGLKVGVALNPATPLYDLEYVLDQVDMVLLMCVNPGFGGQKYLPFMTGKIKELKAVIDRNHLNVDIEVDGGINEQTIEKVVDAGANILVAGSAVFDVGRTDERESLLKFSAPKFEKPKETFINAPAEKKTEMRISEIPAPGKIRPVTEASKAKVPEVKIPESKRNVEDFYPGSQKQQDKTDTETISITEMEHNMESAVERNKITPAATSAPTMKSLREALAESVRSSVINSRGNN